MIVCLLLEGFAFSLPTTKLGQGNIFRSVSQEFCPKGCLGPGPGGRLGGWPGGLQVYTPGGGWLSRPTSGGGGLGGLAGGSPGLHPGGRLGLQAHTCGRLGEVWQGVSRPTPGKVSKPRPRGGGVQTQAQGDVSQHALRQTPPPPTATAVGGTHPTGMHSCYVNFWTIQSKNVTCNARGIHAFTRRTSLKLIIILVFK